MSRGHLVFSAIISSIGILAFIFNYLPTDRKVSFHMISLKAVAIVALLTTTLMTIPRGMIHNILIENL